MIFKFFLYQNCFCGDSDGKNIFNPTQTIFINCQDIEKFNLNQIDKSIQQNHNKQIYIYYSTQQENHKLFNLLCDLAKLNLGLNDEIVQRYVKLCLNQ